MAELEKKEMDVKEEEDTTSDWDDIEEDDEQYANLDDLELNPKFSLQDLTKQESKNKTLVSEIIDQQKQLIKNQAIKSSEMTAQKIQELNIKIRPIYIIKKRNRSFRSIVDF